MIKGAIVATALVAVGTTSALAEIVFGGAFVVTAVTSQCQDTSVGKSGTSQFHPNVAGNLNFSAISFVHQFYATGYKLPSLPFDSTFRNVQSGGVGWGDPFTWTGSQVRLLTTLPSITTATRFVSLKGQIKKFERDSGGATCVVTFDASYIRR